MQKLRMLFVATGLTLTVSASAGQVKFDVGQNVQPVYEGWQWNADGTITMHFGYLNRNYGEELDVPLGPANHFEPGPPDRGQPTHFVTRRHRFVFDVRLPKEWDPKARLTWVVTANGQSDTAQGWLQPEWEMNEGVEQMNIGPGGAPDENNKAPEVKGATAYTTAVAAPVTLTINATDDGIPKPRKPRNEQQAKLMRPQGVTIAWVQYRGPGGVQFDPDGHPPTYGQAVTATTRATFGASGDYVVRAVVGDGTLETHFDINVTVTPRGAPPPKR